MLRPIMYSCAMVDICTCVRLKCIPTKTFRPSDILVSGLRSYRDSIFYLSIYLPLCRPLRRSSLNGTQPKPATCLEVSAIRKCMSEMRGIPSPANREPQNHFFRRLRNLRQLQRPISSDRNTTQTIGDCVGN